MIRPPDSYGLDMSPIKLRSRHAATALLFVLSCGLRVAHAQGGPPLVTDDPGTPGDGHWEINLATIIQRVDGITTASFPDADINYGWGPTLQLKLDVPLTVAQEPDGARTAGLGTSELGVKWRFIDGGEKGLSVSTYPQLISGFGGSFVRRGLAEGGHQYFLPIEVAWSVGERSYDFEVGRNFVTEGPDQWVFGGIVATDCLTDTECMAEIHEITSAAGHATLLNFGFHHGLSKTLSLIGAAGDEWGPAGASPRHVLVYLGFQILR
jgi:hypothetical protein